MAFDYDVLIEIRTVPNSDSTSPVFIQGGGQKSYLRTIMMHNTSVGVVNIKLHRVPNDSGSVGIAHSLNVFVNEDLTPGETLLIEITSPGMVFRQANDSLFAYASVDNVVTIQAYGGVE